MAALHWFNPVLWLAFARMRADRELACDAMVLRRTQRRDGIHYGHTILNLLERSSGRGSLPGVVGVLESKKHVQRRITMIASFKHTAQRWKILGLLLLLGLGVLALTDARAVDSAAAPPAAKPPAEPKEATAGPAESRPAEAGVAWPGGEDEATRRVRQKLASKISPTFQEVEFKEVVRFFSQVTGVNIFVNWTALEAAGIQQGAPVTVNLQNVTAETALKKVLESVGGLTTLSYVIENGVLSISTREDLARRTVTRVYDVRDLLAEYPGGAGAVGAEAMAGLMATLMQAVDLDSWRPSGIGAMRDVQGNLVVTQSLENHEALRALLTALREGRLLQWQAKIRQKLQKMLERVEFDDTPWMDVMQFVAAATDANIVLDPAVRKEELPAVKISARNLTGEQLLSLIVRMAGLDWRLADGVVYISGGTAAQAGPMGRGIPPGQALPWGYPGAPGMVGYPPGLVPPGGMRPSPGGRRVPTSRPAAPGPK